MAKKIIRTGTTADPIGDSLKNAFTKVNDNFTELYNALGLVTDITLNLGNFKFTGSTLSLDDPEDSTLGITIDTLVKINSDLSVGGDILPQTANGGDLGSSTLPWRSLYVSQSTIYLGGVPLTLDANGNLTVNGSQVGATSYADLTGKPALTTVATTGAYADLTGKPTIPTLVSQLANDSGFLTSVGNISNIQSEGNINIDINLADSTLRRWQFGEDGELTFPDGYLKIVPNGANPYISNRTDNGLGFVSGNSIQIRQSTADAYGISINSSTDSNLGGGTELASGSNIDVNGTKIILGKYTVSNSDANNGLSVQNKVEINNDAILIGQYVSALADGFTTSAFSGWTFGTYGTLTFPDATVQTTAWTGIANALRSEGNINIDINLSDSTLRRWQFGEDGLLTFPDGTNQSTAYTSVYAQSGATSAYATQRVLQYNPSTNAVTYSNTLDAVRAYITGYSSEIHVSPVAADDTGNGTIGDPVKTIARAQALAALAFETTAAGSRKTIVLHPGDYVEDVTISTQYTVLTTHELVGKNTTLTGTLTITKGCTIDGLKMTNLVISATSAFGSVDIIGCTVTTATTKTSTAYTVFRGCDLSSSTLSITGSGTTALVGGNYFTLAVNNAAAGVLAKAVITMGPVTLTAGTLQLSDTLIYSATNTSYAITQSAYSVLTINNCQTLIPDLSNVSRISLNGFYSILSAVYDKPNSILATLSATGGPLNSIIYDQYINADRLTLSSGGQITFPDATVQTTAWTGSVAAGTLTGTALASGVVSSSLTSVGTLRTLAVTGAVTAETFNTDQITVVGNRITTTVTNANLELECNGSGALTISGSIIGTATQNVFNTTSTTINAFGEATTLNIGASGAPITGFAATATTSSTASSLGYLGLPQSATATTATLAIGDAGKHIYITTTGQTITIPAASSVAYPIGTTLTFIAGPSATTATIAITTDTLRLAGGTSTGSRTLAANGMATAVKVSGTSSAGVWYINGVGLT